MTTRTARLLWILTALFALRVLGQMLVEFLHVDFLPPPEAWYSGLIPYPVLLPCQIAIIALQMKIDLDFTRQAGWAHGPSRRAGQFLLWFGAIYLAAMIVRFVIRMEIYPDQPWAGATIAIVFHWVLAAYLLAVGRHHWRESRAGQFDRIQ
jgi:hypothetical protein